MRFTTIGGTGVTVSRLCFGTMSFGGNADEDESGRLFKRCLDEGINFFDSANVYNGGESERILGRLMKGMRDDLVITSKVFGRTGPSPNDRGLSRRHILSAIEGTLQRLGTDHLDVYFVHQFDPSTDMEQTLSALDTVVRRGQVRYLGASNWAAWQVMKALGISARRELARFDVLQPMYNLVKRQVEVEILPLAHDQRLGVIPYSPLGGGLLTGKYKTGPGSAAGRLKENASYTKRYEDPANYRVAANLSALAGARGVHPATLAVAWVASHPDVTAPIIGARDVEQLEPSLAAAEYPMSPELRAEITALTPSPPPATDRSEEA